MKFYILDCLCEANQGRGYAGYALIFRSALIIRILSAPRDAIYRFAVCEALDRQGLSWLSNQLSEWSLFDLCLEKALCHPERSAERTVEPEGRCLHRDHALFYYTQRIQKNSLGRGYLKLFKAAPWRKASKAFLN